VGPKSLGVSAWLKDEIPKIMRKQITAGRLPIGEERSEAGRRRALVNAIKILGFD